ncbi:IS630 family transposase, partial [Nonomuraea typhae]
LERALQAWIDTWNENPRPFLWTKTAEEIFETIAAYLKRINDSEH